jgi:hypothetical protein
MEKWFIAQAVTGEDIDTLRDETRKIYHAIELKGDKAYSSILEGDNFEKKSNESKMNHAFNEIDKRENLLAIIRSEKKSEGMLIEFGYAKGKHKNLTVAIKENINNTYVPELANQTIKYKNIEDLCEKIRGI